MTGPETTPGAAATGELASIDDLLRHEEEPPRLRRRRRGGRAWWLRTVLGALALTAVTVAGLRVVGVALPVVVVFAGHLALLTLRRFTGQVAAPPRSRGRTRRGVEPDGYPWDPEDALRTVVAGWERRLGGIRGEGRPPARTVRALIAGLADERLRQRHGCTRASDPERARALLGDELWKFLTTSSPRKPTPRDCAAMAARLEKL